MCKFLPRGHLKPTPHVLNQAIVCLLTLTDGNTKEMELKKRRQVEPYVL